MFIVKTKLASISLHCKCHRYTAANQNSKHIMPVGGLSTLCPKKLDRNINCYNSTITCHFCLKFWTHQL